MKISKIVFLAILLTCAFGGAIHRIA